MPSSLENSLYTLDIIVLPSYNNFVPQYENFSEVLVVVDLFKNIVVTHGPSCGILINHLILN